MVAYWNSRKYMGTGDTTCLNGIITPRIADRGPSYIMWNYIKWYTFKMFECLLLFCCGCVRVKWFCRVIHAYLFSTVCSIHILKDGNPLHLIASNARVEWRRWSIKTQHLILQMMITTINKWFLLNKQYHHSSSLSYNMYIYNIQSS